MGERAGHGIDDDSWAGIQTIAGEDAAGLDHRPSEGQRGCATPKPPIRGGLYPYRKAGNVVGAATGDLGVGVIAVIDGVDLVLREGAIVDANVVEGAGKGGADAAVSE